MRILVMFLLLSGSICFATTNDAVPAMLDARYDFAACNVEYADDWLEMREQCGVEEEVDVFDSSDYMEELHEDLAEMREAADDGDQLEFGLEALQLGLDSLDLLGAVFVDALDHKTLSFFSCVREGEEPLMEARDECRSAAFDKERAAATDYVNNEIDYANEQIADMEELGADTSGMEQVVQQGEELVDDIDPAFDTEDVTEIRKLHLRHSRLVMLFRAEKMLATIDYARPEIEDSSNSNKEEILEAMDELEDDIDAWLTQCEYSADVEDNGDYGRDNLECWDDSLDLYEDFHAISVLILEGILS